MELEPAIKSALKEMLAGRLAEADAIARRVIHGHPDQPAGYHLLGDIYYASGKVGQALISFEKAISLNPDAHMLHLKRANTLRKLTRYGEAIAAYTRALQLSPNDADVLLNMGIAYRMAQDIDQSFTALQRSLMIRRDHAMAHFEMGVLFEQMGRPEEAIEAYQQAIELDPRMASAHDNLGGLYAGMGRVDEAVEACERGARLDPTIPKALSNLALAWEQAGRPERAAECHRRAALLAPRDAKLASRYLHSLYFHPECPMKTLRHEHNVWNQRYGEPMRAAYYPHDNDRDTERPLKVGYVSPNFLSGAQAAFVLPLLMYHNHCQFEVYCYSDLDDERSDGVTSRIQLCADHWRETGRRDATSLADWIRTDRIDVLVDLTMHMKGNRMLALATKPAPVQFAFPAYPGTTGVWSMEYRLTDPFLDPPAENADHYSEESIRLPRTFACYDPSGLDPEPAAFKDDLALVDADPGPPPAQANGFLTFGCFNNFRKMNETVLKRWSMALRTLPDSRLRLLAPSKAGQRWVAETLGALGIEAGRIEFVGEQSRGKYLREFRAVDVCLDTPGYCGHASSLDAIWMGAPVITQIGSTAPARIGWSMANNLQSTELAARTDEELVSIVTGLANDIPRLAELRRTLRKRLLDSPLMDGAGYTREVEAVYRQMWRRWAGGKKARS